VLIGLDGLARFVGVADIASVRFSLPAHLLEPTPNLEYWNYLDRPEAFASIGQSEDPLGRTLEVLRFWFTKDLVYCPHSRCIVNQWQVIDQITEIHQRQTMQAVQFYLGGILQSRFETEPSWPKLMACSDSPGISALGK
jgi:hypothetical protein